MTTLVRFYFPGLNPYSIGIWSATYVKITQNRMGIVLILILLEYGLRQVKAAKGGETRPCLNPYSIGIWSATPKIANH